ENRAADFARNIVLRFNQAEENVGREYIATYEQTWGVSELGKGSIHTQQQMQDIVNAMPQSTALLLLQSGQRFVQTYGDGLPTQYRQPAWAYTLHNSNTIVIGELLPLWQVVSDPVI
ncbi:MAG: hypothetical protein ACK6EB_24910, partial [Planctomyces sp.]